jgi:hypothetical protein
MKVNVKTVTAVFIGVIFVLYLFGSWVSLSWDWILADGAAGEGARFGIAVTAAWVAWSYWYLNK